MTPEQVKLYHETFKHLTTLSTGAVVLMSALLKASDHITQVLIVISMGSMVFVSILSIMMMFGLAAGDYNKKWSGFGVTVERW